MSSLAVVKFVTYVHVDPWREVTKQDSTRPWRDDKAEARPVQTSSTLVAKQRRKKAERMRTTTRLSYLGLETVSQLLRVLVGWKEREKNAHAQK